MPENSVYLLRCPLVFMVQTQTRVTKSFLLGGHNVRSHVETPSLRVLIHLLGEGRCGGCVCAPVHVLGACPWKPEFGGVAVLSHPRLSFRGRISLRTRSLPHLPGLCHHEAPIPACLHLPCTRVTSAPQHASLQACRNSFSIKPSPKPPNKAFFLRSCWNLM